MQIYIENTCKFMQIHVIKHAKIYRFMQIYFYSCIKNVTNLLKFLQIYLNLFKF